MDTGHGTNGTGHPRDTRTDAEREAEAEVLRLLPGCSLPFLGWLKLEGVGRVQREKLGVVPSGQPEHSGRKVAGRPPG